MSYASSYLQGSYEIAKSTRVFACFLFSYPERRLTMDYGMIGKREKAKRYAEEQKRFVFNKFDVTFHGDNNNHHVTFDNGVYHCDCEFFMTHQRCAHTMALEIKFQGMVPETV